MSKAFRIWWHLALLAAASVLFTTAAAQDAAETPPASSEGGTAAPSQTQQPASENWASRCVASARLVPLECSIEQRLIMQNTQQLVASVTIRVPAETNSPVMLVQAPLGLFLPGGIALDVDGASGETLELQTCDNNGCYAGGPLPENLLAAMTRGQSLNIKFQNLNKQTITVTATLVGFTAAFQRIR